MSPAPGNAFTFNDVTNTLMKQLQSMDLRDSFTLLKVTIEAKQNRVDKNGRSTVCDFKYSSEKHYAPHPWSDHSSDITNVTSDSSCQRSNRSSDRSFESIESIPSLEDISLPYTPLASSVPSRTLPLLRRVHFYDDTCLPNQAARPPVLRPREDSLQNHSVLNYAQVHRIPALRGPHNQQPPLDETGNYEPAF